MRRWGIGKWGLALGMALVVGATTRAAEPDDDYAEPGAPAATAKSAPNERPGLIDYLFGWTQRPAKPAPTKPRAKPTAEKPKDESPAPVSAAEREQEAFLRRLAVCDRLRQIAADTQDDQLRQLADQLQDRAWKLCAQRARLDTSNLDETVLNDHLGTVDPAAALPARSTAAVPGNRANQARVKENLP